MRKKFIYFLIRLFNIETEIDNDYAKNIGQKLAIHATWFKRDSQEKKLLEEYSKHFIEYGQPDISVIRKKICNV